MQKLADVTLDGLRHLGQIGLADAQARIGMLEDGGDLTVNVCGTVAGDALGKLGAGMGRNEVFLRLLVNEEADAFLKSAANLIVEELSYVNITVELTVKPAAEYRAALQSGDFDLYLGDIRLTKNMDLSPFFTPDGAASWGIDLDGSDLPALWADYQSGAKELDVFLNRFNELMPFIPLVYRNGQFCYSRVIRSAIQSTEDRLYYNIEEWLV